MRAPIGFAHRGARADARRENTLESFSLALRLGADALESDVWLTSDGVPVLEHDGVLRRGLRRVPLRRLASTDLPSWLPRLADLYSTCGTGFELSLDVKDPAAFPTVLRTAAEAGDDAPGRLWLCTDRDTAASWRRLDADVHLVDSTSRRYMPEGLAARAARLREDGIDAVNLRQDEWTPELVAAVHEHGRLAFGWDAQRREVLDRLLAAGCDAVYSDHVERMVAALTHAG